MTLAVDLLPHSSPQLCMGGEKMARQMAIQNQPNSPFTSKNGLINPC